MLAKVVRQRAASCLNIFISYKNVSPLLLFRISVQTLEIEILVIAPLLSVEEVELAIKALYITIDGLCE